MRFHDLRHTYASLLIANNESPKRIQALMGHSSIMVTFDTYGHLFPNVQDGLAERLASTVLGISGKTCSKPVANSYRPQDDEAQIIEHSWWAVQGSNRRPAD